MQTWKEKFDSFITKPISPEDSSWDHLKPPVVLYLVSSFYVVAALLLGPPLLKYRPALPFHAIFFAFNLVTLLVNFCLFFNALILFYSKTSLPIRLLTLLLDEHGPIIVNLTWLHCVVKMFEFLGEAVTLLHHKHDNYRFLKITYFLIQLTNIWLRLRHGSPPFFSFATLYNLIFDLTILFYSSFEPSMHVNCPELKTKVERFICVMEIGQLFSILAQILPKPDGSNENEFSRTFTLYMVGFTLTSIAMLVVISWKADVIVRDTSTMIKQGRDSVVFEDYNFKAEPVDGEDFLPEPEQEEEPDVPEQDDQ